MLQYSSTRTATASSSISWESTRITHPHPLRCLYGSHRIDPRKILPQHPRSGAGRCPPFRPPLDYSTLLYSRRLLAVPATPTVSTHTHTHTLHRPHRIDQSKIFPRRRPRRGAGRCSSFRPSLDYSRRLLTVPATPIACRVDAEKMLPRSFRFDIY